MNALCFSFDSSPLSHSTEILSTWILENLALIHNIFFQIYHFGHKFCLLISGLQPLMPKFQILATPEQFTLASELCSKTPPQANE